MKHAQGKVGGEGAELDMCLAMVGEKVKDRIVSAWDSTVISLTLAGVWRQVM